MRSPSWQTLRKVVWKSTWSAPARPKNAPSNGWLPPRLRWKSNALWMRSIARKYGFAWRARVNIADAFDPEFRKGKTMGLRIERWICLTAVLVTLSSLALAQGAGHPDKGPNPDEPAIHDYVLTMDKIKKYADVTKRLEAAAKSDPALAAAMKKIEEADDYNLYKAAMLEKSPRLAAALNSSDITARDFVLTPLTAFTAAIGIAAG